MITKAMLVIEEHSAEAAAPTDAPLAAAMDLTSPELLHIVGRAAPGLLADIATVLRRQHVDIDSLMAYRDEADGTMHVTTSLRLSEDGSQRPQLVRQLQHLADVHAVSQLPATLHAID